MDKTKQEIKRIYDAVLKKRVKKFEQNNPNRFEGLAILHNNLGAIYWYKDHLCFIFSDNKEEDEFHLYYDDIVLAKPIPKISFDISYYAIFLNLLKKLILEIV